MSERTERADFQATGDPALKASADHGRSELLDYDQLYALWERQHWRVQDIDFAQDRVDWHERIGAEERFQRMYGLSSFFIGEQRVAAELGPMMRAAPDERMRIFLCTQIADEARHVAFFDRFYSERPAGEKFGTHSGLGLSISKQIVEAHDGTIIAANRLDEDRRVCGARFTVTLPAAGG